PARSTVNEWEEFLFQRVGDGWVYRGEYSGPLASDGENLYAARHNVIGVWRDREFIELAVLDEKYKITGLAWDTEHLWASAHDYYGDGEELAYIFRIDPSAGRVDGWLPYPWVVYSVWTFRQWYEFTHVGVVQGLASDGERLHLVAEDSVWTADPAAVCKEDLPEALGYCEVAGTKVYDGPDGGVIGELRVRDPVYILEKGDGWWRVFTPAGEVGWVPADAVVERFKVSLEPPD
ncbi:SH3 domain-containing protein, partial [bacterium]|nr:SH3 domain-containing protein [bacterium]